ncbi:MAG: glycosyltransferase family 2 protein [Gemmatimonadaceae bacterium]
MPEPVFGVVLVNWNGADDTVAALESLLSATPRPKCVVLVDNGSTQESVDRILAWGTLHTIGMQVEQLCREGADPAVSSNSLGAEYAWLTVICAGDNRGFAGGNNVGLRRLAAREDVTHFLLLNNDATVAPDYFARMTDALHAFPDAGLLGCVIHHHPERDRIWYAGGYEIPYRALVLHNYSPPIGTTPRPTEFVTGCAMLISRRLYESQGALANCYNPIYWEDGEYSFRARTHGWQVMLVPAARVYHKVGTSVGGEKVTPRVAFWQNRNRAYYVRRNYRGGARLGALVYLAVTKPGRAIVEVMRGKPAMGSAILRGFLHGVLDDVTDRTT